MNRRDLLKAAPAAALVAPLPVTAAVTETPIAALFREWASLYTDLNGDDGNRQDEPAFDAACERLSSIEAAIMHTPSTNADDLMMKVASFTSYGGFEISDCKYAKASIIWDEMRALTGVQT